jgi:C4-dicarboxylate-specific signal transduction histidine kinase
MRTVELILSIASVLISALAVFASAYALLVIWRGRDKAYRQKYHDFLKQKERVEERIEEARNRQG